ncbi:MAG: hypothetical protein ABMA25_04950 [Ilumatobacteraceae bacterium]
MEPTNIRHLRRVAPPLASYLRVGHRDGALAAKLIEQGLPVGAGMIVDQSAALRTSELRSSALENGIEVILDPRSVELSTIGGMASATVARLPWAHSSPQTPATLAGVAGLVLTERIAAAAVEQRVTGVLAPSHFLDADEQWLGTDVALAGALRSALDAAGARQTVVYYPVVASLRLLSDHTLQRRVLAEVGDLVASRQIDAVFLRVHGFGTAKAGPRNLRSYLRVARALHQLRVPIVGERTGTVGVALAAFGAIGGVESAITYGDNYDARRLNHLPKGRGFVPPPKAYIGPAMAMCSLDDSATVGARQGFARLRCQGACCAQRRGEMLADPRRHFIVTRANEMTRLSGLPESNRANDFLATILTPARETSAQIARFLPSFAPHRDRLDDWHLALQRTIAEDAETERSTALAPTGHRHRRSA